MHFFLPPWLRHGRPRAAASVFSVDVEPHGTRLASAGQDCAVKIWSLSVLASLAVPAPTGPNPPPVPTPAATSAAPHIPPPGALLATISSHSSAVNCVRWAPVGSLLASGGDDAVVLIYERLPGPARSSAFAGGGGGGGVENWRVRRPLRAHAGDVTDICWSPDGERLASASVDNVIYIWSVRNERAVVRLDGHKGLVKGVAWDPVGRYLASQSDDRSVRIWRTSDWKTEKVISKPFDSAVYKENSMAFFLRISWSPCGTQLLATNAYRKPGAHHAPMFSRESGFEEQIEFVGHREPVVSTRFSSRLYRSHPRKVAAARKAIEAENRKNKENAGYVKKALPTEESTYVCLALGSKDCGATIWQATGVRPFFDMAQMFDSDVIDLSWGTDGYTLVSCSTDGKIMYVRFESEELGVVVSQEETREILTKVWREFGGGGNSAAPIAESVTQLQMEGAQRPEDSAGKSRKINGESSPQDEQSVARGIERVEIIEETLDSEANRPTEKAGAVVTDKKPPVSTPDRRGTLPAPVVAAAAAVRENGPTPPADPRVMAAQAEVRVRGGKRRITPMAVTADEGAPGAPENSSSAIKPLPMDIDGDSMPVPASPWKRPRGNAFSKDLDDSKDAPSLSKVDTPLANGNHAFVNGTISAPKRDPRNILQPPARPVSHASNLHAPSIVGLSMMLLPDRGEGVGRCRIINEGTPAIVLESREHHGSGGGYVVMCSAGGEVQWRDYHPKSSPVTALAGIGGKYVAVGTADGALFLYSAPSGRRLAPPVILDSAPYMLEAVSVHTEDGSDDTHQDEDVEKWYVILVSRCALCSVFDVKAKKLVCARSAAPLLAKPQEMPAAGQTEENATRASVTRDISQCMVTTSGEPILVLSDGLGFVYSKDFCCWLRVADDASPNSDFVRTVPSSNSVGVLRTLQSGMGLPRKSLPNLSGMADLQRSAVESLAHLESLMESAVVLRSGIDYRYYLTNYATRIAAAVNDDVENCVVRLRELCDLLLNSRDPSCDEKILGMSSRDLLRNTVLPVVSTNRRMQRFVAEYTESLKEIDKMTQQAQCK